VEEKKTSAVYPNAGILFEKQAKREEGPSGRSFNIHPFDSSRSPLKRTRKVSAGFREAMLVLFYKKRRGLLYAYTTRR